MEGELYHDLFCFDFGAQLMIKTSHVSHPLPANEQFAQRLSKIKCLSDIWPAKFSDFLFYFYFTIIVI